jgi:hypothetical protein
MQAESKSQYSMLINKIYISQLNTFSIRYSQIPEIHPIRFCSVMVVCCFIVYTFPFIKYFLFSFSDIVFSHYLLQVLLLCLSSKIPELLPFLKKTRINITISVRRNVKSEITFNKEKNSRKRQQVECRKMGNTICPWQFHGRV